MGGYDSQWYFPFQMGQAQPVQQPFWSPTPGMSYGSPAAAPSLAASGPTAATPAAQIPSNNIDGVPGVQQPNNNMGWANFGLNTAFAAGQLGLGIAGLVKGFEMADFQKAMAEKNYAAQILAYNNSLEDKLRGRYGGGAAASQRVADELDRRKQG